MAFVSKWSDDVRLGVLFAVFEQRKTRKQAHALATRGELPQVEPGKPRPAAVDVPLGTVQDWCRHERARRVKVASVAAGPVAVLGDTVARLAAVHEREVRRAERQSARGQLQRGELAKIARDGIELARLSRALSAGDDVRSNGPSAPGNAAPGTSGAGERSWLEGLASDA